VSAPADFLTLDELEIRAGAGVTARMRVRPDGPYQAGHYPDFPIFPGVFVVEAAREAVVAHARARASSDGAPAATLRSVDSVRFAKPLRPGDVLVVDATCTRDGDILRAKVRCADAAGDPTAKITLSFGRQEETSRRPAAPVRQDVTSERPAAPVRQNVSDLTRLLPHRDPMLLVDRVVELQAPDRIVTERTVAPGEPCFATSPAGAAYPPLLVLESFAQSCGVLWRLSAPEQRGLLVFGAARGVEFHAPALAGQTLRHTVRLDYTAGDNAMFTGESHVDGRLVLTVASAVTAVRDAAVLAGS
jgi:3-hydroxymyristoyl/3-hydroxydecanoyl-(acyl carrier protein) dehydratase